VRPAVILQDLFMPDIDGPQPVKFVCANPAARETPMIVLSGKEGPTVEAHAFAPAANDYLVKLSDFAELVGARRGQKFSVTARQVTLYLGGMRPGPATWAAARYPSSWRRSPRCSRRAVWYVCPCARTVGACAAR
jgi:hypothetical protein